MLSIVCSTPNDSALFSNSKSANRPQLRFGRTYTTTTGYNAKGELTSYSYPDGTAVGRSYTARGELYQLTHAGTTIDTRVYDNGGRMTSSTYNNGVSETRAYNTDNTLASINFAGASIGNLTYGWDANKNKTSEAIAGTMSNYGFTVPTNGYDSEDRLVGFNRTSGLTQSWSLSAVGDWNSVTTNGTAQTRTHGLTHELLTAGGQNISIDVKGNITFIPASLRPTASSLTSVWDFDNRLNTADVGSDGSVDVTYKFDAIGRRVFRDNGTTATIFVQAGQQTIADYTASSAPSSPTYRYVYASYIDEPALRFKPSGSESLYYHRNQQYSVVALTNSSAAIVERYAYSAYGVPTITNASGTLLPIGSVDNRYLYTGREWDQTLSLYHYRARMYDANLGRFASRDHIGYSLSREQYHYCRGLAPKRTDPSGLQDVILDVKVLPPGPINTNPPLKPTNRILPQTVPLTPNLDCLSFLGYWRGGGFGPGFSNHPDVEKAISCNVNVFCSPIGCGKQMGKGGAVTFPKNGRGQICMDGRAKMTPTQWLALLTHEAIHAAKLIGNGDCGCPTKPHTGPNPPVPPLSGSGNPSPETCNACKDNERPAYEAQAAILFPGDQLSQIRFVESGLCASCKHVCSEYGKGCAPFPPYDPPFEF